LKDPDIITLAQVRMGDILRKRGRYETAVGLLKVIGPTANTASAYVQGVRWQVLARAHSAYGKEDAFLEAIDHAQEIAKNTKETIDMLSNQFDLVEVLQERGQGYTMLWLPQKALEIYQETDRLKPFRPTRNLGSYTIIKAQAHAYSGDIDTGIDLAIQGVNLAQNYQSRRHVSRVQGMYDRLNVTSMANHHRMRDLKSALMHARETLKKVQIGRSR
jgi:tetratricopeptide (TPR) repeat protein